MSDSDFGTSDPLTGFDPPEGNAHQSEYTHDNRYIVTGEEDFSAFRLTELSVSDVGTFAATSAPAARRPTRCRMLT